MKIKVGIIGLRHVQSKLEKLKPEMMEKVDEVVEREALEFVNETRERAPVLTGKLRNSIDIMPQYTKPLTRVYGTSVEYARRQEFEHATKKGFFRKTVASRRPKFFKAVENAIDDMLR